MTACAVLVAAALTACSGGGGDGDGTAGKQTGAPWFDEVTAAASAGPATACALPVKLPVVERWRVKPVRLDGGPMDALAQQGDVTMACEIDAKPAGPIGFLRVWIARPDATQPRPVLESFLGADRGLTDVAYRDVDAGGLTAVEATYLREGPTEPAGKRERAFAVATSQGIAVVTLSGLDNKQYQAMLPAYVLARQQITPAA